MSGGEGKSEKSFWRALTSILVADISMSIDNIVAVAAIARENTQLLIFGLALGGFLVYHLGLVYHGMTTNESHKWSSVIELEKDTKIAYARYLQALSEGMEFVHHGECSCSLFHFYGACKHLEEMQREEQEEKRRRDDDEDLQWGYKLSPFQVPQKHILRVVSRVSPHGLIAL